jgi:leader peptidase (prepilin peptidase)/N-methyltransferase
MSMQCWSNSIRRSLTAARSPDEMAFVVAGALGLAASVLLLPDARGAAGGVLALLMVAVAAVDARRFIIPDELSLAAFALGLVHAAIQSEGELLAALAEAVLRGGVLAGAFLGLRYLYGRLRGREGIGLGDVKLAGVGGVWLDWPTMPIAIEIAALSAIAVYAVRHFYYGRSVSATTRLPFGLFLAPAIWLGWLLQSTLLSLPSAVTFR